MKLKLNIKVNYGYFFILPFFLVVLLFQVYPIVDTVMTSFTDDNLSHPDTPPQFVGLENYVREASAPLVAKALFNTLVISLCSMVIQLGLALLLTARLTNHELKIRSKNAWQVIFFLPSQIAVSVVSLYLIFFFNARDGVVNSLIHGGNAQAYVDFFDSGISSWVFIIATTVFVSFGITAYFLINSVQAMPRQTLEAAIIDGASANQVFRHISLPFIRPILGFLVILSLILNLCQFDIPFALYPSPSGGSGSRAEALGPPGGVDQNGMTLGTYAYHRAFVWDSDLGSAAAVVVLMFALIAMLSALYFLVLKRGQDDFSVLR